MRSFPQGKTIWIVRHGNRADFVDPTWSARAARPFDPPLSPDGRLQAQCLAQRLKSEPIRHVFVSPFLRTLETAAPVAEALKLPLKIEPGLGEFLYPAWFKTAPELPAPTERAAHFPVDIGYQPHGQATYPELDEVADCWPRAGRTARALAENFDGDLLFICHGATMAGATYGLLADFPLIHCGLCFVVKTVWTGRRWDLVLGGDASHLANCDSPP